MSAGSSVIDDSRSLKLTCGFIVRTETNLSCKVLFWLALLIITPLINISKKFQHRLVGDNRVNDLS